MAKCRVGDLAVVVTAQHKCNIGNIVHVIGPDDGTGDIVFKGQGRVWKVKGTRLITWKIGKKRYRRKFGPCPENRLQPIRGLTPGQQVNKSIGVAPSKKVKRSTEAVPG